MNDQLVGIRGFVERRGGLGPLLCLISGALLSGVALLWVAVHWLSAPNWATVEGRVVEAGVSSSTHNRTPTRRRRNPYQETRYQADIVYHYRVDGRDYTGHGIGDGSDWNHRSRDSAAAEVARYSRGALTVYYDPADPERSALNTNIFGIVPWILGGIGLPLLGFGFWWRRSRLTEAQDIG